MKYKKGFTLIELLIVIAVMAILSGVVFVALNPLARFQDARNNRRHTDEVAIISALKLHQVDNGGVFQEAVVDLEYDKNYMIGTGDDASGIICAYPDVVLEAQTADLTWYVSTGGYLPSVPIDPDASANGSDEQYTGYYLNKSETGAITIGSCFEEAGSIGTPSEISVKR